MLEQNGNIHIIRKNRSVPERLSEALEGLLEHMKYMEYIRIQKCSKYFKYILKYSQYAK